MPQNPRAEATILNELLELGPRPHLARIALNEIDVAEFAQGGLASLVGRLAAFNPLAGGHLEVGFDFLADLATTTMKKHSSSQWFFTTVLHDGSTMVLTMVLHARWFSTTVLDCGSSDEGSTGFLNQRSEPPFRTIVEPCVKNPRDEPSSRTPCSRFFSASSVLS